MKAPLAFFLLATLLAKSAVISPDPANTRLTMASFAGIQGITNKITACLWVTRDANAQAAGVMISKGGDTAGTAEQWSIGGLTNRLYFYFFRMGSPLTTESKTGDVFTNLNTLTFVAMSYDYANSNSLTWYINNGQITGNTFFVNPVSAGPTNNAAAMEIGQGRDSSTPCGGGSRWTGYYSEVAIWDAILTPHELETIRRSHIKGMAKQIRTTNLKSYLPLDSIAAYREGIPITSTNASRFPDRQTFGPFAYVCNVGTTRPIGVGDRICSYYPNE